MKLWNNEDESKFFHLMLEGEKSPENLFYHLPCGEYAGDYKTHKGCPSLLRSDSMLKAIGKSINIRVSGEKSCHIPIVVLGNTPITKGYEHKADYLKTSGVVQGFWSLNPAPCNDDDYAKETAQQGFVTVQDERMLENLVDSVKPLYTIFLLYTNH